MGIGLIAGKLLARDAVLGGPHVMLSACRKPLGAPPCAPPIQGHCIWGRCRGLSAPSWPDGQFTPEDIFGQKMRRVGSGGRLFRRRAAGRPLCAGFGRRYRPKGRAGGRAGPTGGGSGRLRHRQSRPGSDRLFRDRPALGWWGAGFRAFIRQSRPAQACAPLAVAPWRWSGCLPPERCGAARGALPMLAHHRRERWQFFLCGAACLA